MLLHDYRKFLKFILFSCDFFNASYVFFINIFQLYWAHFGSTHTKITMIKRRLAPAQGWHAFSGFVEV